MTLTSKSYKNNTVQIMSFYIYSIGIYCNYSSMISGSVETSQNNFDLNKHYESPYKVF